MDSDDEGEEEKKTKAPKFPIQMFITEGNKYLRLAKYDLAIQFFNTALEREPNHEKSLVGRSKCKMRLAKYSEAMEDAKKALKANKNSCDAKLLIGEAEYFLGDFEQSFLTFYRAHQARTNHERLRCGHQMSMKAIENALKPDEPMVFTDTDVSKFDDFHDDEQVAQSRTRKDILSPYVDFVETLLLDDSLQSVHPLCKYLNTYLKDRQTFWRSQNPKTSNRKVRVQNSVALNDSTGKKASKKKVIRKDRVDQDTNVKLASKEGKDDSIKITTEKGKDNENSKTSSPLVLLEENEKDNINFDVAVHSKEICSEEKDANEEDTETVKNY